LFSHAQEEKGSGLGLPVKTLTGEVVFEAKASQLKASQLKHKVLGEVWGSIYVCDLRGLGFFQGT
jgi:hypothetical protein